MIRKWTIDKELENDEQVMEATKSVTVRADGEKAVIKKGQRYIVSGYYDCFDKPVEIVTEADETEDE